MTVYLVAALVTLAWIMWVEERSGTPRDPDKAGVVALACLILAAVWPAYWLTLAGGWIKREFS